ncbi:PepSY domain-containing protein [Lutibacter sp. A64]|uniref:PepSY domain-containing protein n=1 Tax=Lutibacter sp. A64 TaxID=2918526 RepID=UPI001F051939|nr:PepSY domain-containing protein [Lutibacter sp. A64]UMB53344.1 PepSY domain-containing protein [Lutibacter sp. A64]
MTLSIWRYSHLALAVSSSIFILLASLTGIILAFEPISNRVQPYTTNNLNEITVAEIATTLQKKYAEIISLEIDKNDWVTASIINEEGTNEIFYINPKTGENLGKPKETNALFKFATSLHRSLFLKSIGRFFVGLTSFLLFLISITGIFLIVKKQGGIQNFFSPIIKEKFNPYFHTIFGRWLLIPILIITLSGVYLSLEQFNIIPKAKIMHQEDTKFEEEPVLKLAEFNTFKNTKLSEVKKLEFPFSEFPESYFLLQLKDKELLINQFNGAIISKINYPFTTVISYYSLIFHTGQASIIWSLVLLIACIGILFFMYSGFHIALQRRKSRIKNRYKKDDCEYIILIGSENGSTFYFANYLHSELIRLGKKSFLTELNSYTSYIKTQHLVIMTSTYGAGEAPTNAKKFETLTQLQPQENSFNYSVVGFGSLAYPDFCKYAYEVDELLQKLPTSKRLNDVFTVNNQSLEAYNKWLLQWSKTENLAIRLPKSLISKKKQNASTFEIIANTKAENQPEATFLIKMKALNKVKFKSGDLLSIISEEDGRERLYSIGKLGTNKLILSVKLHNKGVISNRLNNLKMGDKITCSIVKNKGFHLPKKAKNALLIATGTGIGPYLGMIDENNKKTKLQLYWGGRTETSFNLYKKELKAQQKKGNLQAIYVAYSQEQDTKTYVQHLLKSDAEKVAEILKNKGVIMICGSVVMQKDVTQTLDSICQKHLKKSLSYYQNKDAILMDCY